MNETTSGSEWSDGAMVGLFIATLIIPLIGIVAGCIGLNRPATKDQGKFLLGTAIVAGFFWLRSMG
jgi:hypothetical protein